MAMTEQQANRMIDLLESILRGGNIGAGVDDKTAKDLNKAIKGLTKETKNAKEQELKVQAAKDKMDQATQRLTKSYVSNLTQFSRNLGVQMTLVSDALTESTKNLNYEALDLLPAAFQSQLKNSMSTVLKGISKIRTIDDVEEFGKRLEVLNLISKELAKGEIEARDARRRANAVLKKFGTSIKRGANVQEELNKTIEEGIKVQAKVAQQARGGWLAELTDKGKALGGVFGKLAVAATAVYVQLMDVAKPAMRYGTYVADSFQAFRAGMNPEEFASIQAQYRQQIGAAGLSLTDFQKTIMDGANSLTAYTGELKDAVRIQADAFAMARTYGVQDEQATQAFINRQDRLFKEFNSVFSMTAEEFVNMNEQIRNSTAVQENIYRLNRKQRQLYIEQYQQTVAQLRINGLSQEAAMRATEAMAALGAESPKERLKKAAKLQAIGGALGFGPEAGRAAEMIRKRQTATPEFAELMKTMEKRTGAIMGQGLPQEMMVSQMLQTTGLENLLGPKSAFADLNTRQYDAITNLGDAATKRNEQLGDVVAGMQQLNQFFTGPWGKMMGSIASGVGVIASLMLGKGALKGLANMGGGKSLFTKSMGEMKEWFKGASKFGKIAGGALVASALAGAWEFGTFIGTAIFDYLEANFPKVNDWIGKTVATLNPFDNNAGFFEPDKKERKFATAQEIFTKNIGEVNDIIAQKQKEQQALLADTNAANKEANAKQAELLQTQIEQQQEALERLTALLEKSKQQVDETKVQTEQQKVQHKELMDNTSGKSNRLIWTQLAG